jgi:hypothetical protein
MSLKSLVQLFAEKFLVNKKGQVASFASPALDKYTQYTTGYNGPNEWSDDITAPFDGWIKVEGECTGPVYLDVSPYSNALRQGVYRPSGFISCVCRISKGGKINYVFSTGGTISQRRVLLIPCNGSST